MSSLYQAGESRVYIHVLGPSDSCGYDVFKNNILLASPTKGLHHEPTPHPQRALVVFCFYSQRNRLQNCSLSLSICMYGVRDWGIIKQSARLKCFRSLSKFFDVITRGPPRARNVRNVFKDIGEKNTREKREQQAPECVRSRSLARYRLILNGDV